MEAAARSKRPREIVSRRIQGGSFQFEDDGGQLFTIVCSVYGVVVERASIKSDFELDLFRLALARAYHTHSVMVEHKSIGSNQY